MHVCVLFRRLCILSYTQCARQSFPFINITKRFQYLGEVYLPLYPEDISIYGTQQHPRFESEQQKLRYAIFRGLRSGFLNTAHDTV